MMVDALVSVLEVEDEADMLASKTRSSAERSVSQLRRSGIQQALIPRVVDERERRVMRRRESKAAGGDKEVHRAGDGMLRASFVHLLALVLRASSRARASRCVDFSFALRFPPAKHAGL